MALVLPEWDPELAVVKEVEVSGCAGMGTSWRAHYFGDGQAQALLLWACVSF